MSAKSIKLYILPISGGGFPAQLALLSEVYDAMLILRGCNLSRKDYVPDICLGSSGGNVSIYTAMAGGWTPEGICRIIQDYEASMFVKSWWPNFLTFLPTWVLGIFHGSLYQAGYGAYEFFRRRFTHETIKQTEVWTGTYDVERKKNQMFCNLGSRHAYIRGDYFSQQQPFLTGSCPLIYLNGDMKVIAEVSQASASIPLVVSNTLIDGRLYADGGTVFSSPLEPLTPEILRIVKGTLKPVVHMSQNNVETYILTHDNCIVKPECKNVDYVDSIKMTNCQHQLKMIYFSPYQLEDGRKSQYWGDKVKPVTSIIQLLDSMSLRDRNCFVGILETLLVDDQKISYAHYNTLTTLQLSHLLQKMETVKHCGLFLYAENTPSMDLTSFTSADIIKTINHVRGRYGAHMWYIQ